VCVFSEPARVVFSGPVGTATLEKDLLTSAMIFVQGWYKGG